MHGYNNILHYNNYNLLQQEYTENMHVYILLIIENCDLIGQIEVSILHKKLCTCKLCRRSYKALYLKLHVLGIQSLTQTSFSQS